MYPEYIDELIRRIEESGESAYVVGGSLRDMLIGTVPHDYDVTTSALPEKICDVFSDKRVIKTGIKHGTVTVIWNGEPVEITTFRIDGSYTDSRHPDSVSFTSDIVADLSRRDFTVNAMAYNLRNGLVDPFGGAKDIKNKLIRAVGKAEDRFSEDALRIMRAFRFSAQLGFDICEDTLKGAAAAKKGLANIARERIGSEFIKLVTSPYPRLPLELMTREGMLGYVLGEYTPSDKLINTLEKMPVGDVARLGFILCEADEDAARDILEGLRCSLKQIKGALATRRGCLFRVECAEDARRLIANTGEYAELGAEGSEILGVSPSGAAELTLRQKNTPCNLRQLDINGKILYELGVRGKLIGEILDKLMDRVIEDPALNDREALTELARAMINERNGIR